MRSHYGGSQDLNTSRKYVITEATLRVSMPESMISTFVKNSRLIENFNSQTNSVRNSMLSPMRKEFNSTTKKKRNKMSSNYKARWM